MLAPTTVPMASKDVIHRDDPGGILLFQVRTDEMHFISREAFALYSLCDGTRTVTDIEALVAEHAPELRGEEGERRIEEFLEELADRTIIELWRETP